MSEFELPLEAEDLIAQVTKLEERVAASRQDLVSQSEAARQMVERERSELERESELFEALVENRTEGLKRLSALWAEYEQLRADVTAEMLERKSHPAFTAAETVRKKGRELAEVRRHAKLTEYIVELYESLFPWLVELRDTDEADAYLEGKPDVEPEEREKDPVAGWLTAEEYRALPSIERNQRALDRYLKSQKSNWQLGRDYERYIGYLREQAGAAVTYHGIAKGLEDLGRDVLAEKDGRIEVIQCKRWAQAKTIHEKHVFQLYGTVVLCQLENPGKEVVGTFTTTTRLSPKAREVAKFLAIRLEEEVPLDDYPRIKCNVSRVDEELIYHLPMDQQYDSTLVEPERGERYVMTVAEAEEAGFRRAWRWRG